MGAVVMGEEETEEGKCHDIAIHLELNLKKFDNILIIFFKHQIFGVPLRLKRFALHL